MGDLSFLSNIPTIGYVVIMILGILVCAIVFCLIAAIVYLIFRKNIKTKLFEITDVPKQQQRDLLIAEGKDQLDNQSQVAKQLLKKIRIKMYNIGMDLFKIEDENEKSILELITYRIIDRLNYDVRNDLTRNHITKKTDEEIKEYSFAKAQGYYYMIYDRLFTFNSKLPKYELPKIIETYPTNEIEQVFLEIYKSARDIAGKKKEVPENGKSK